MYGYAGKILRVDLTTGKISIEPTSKYAREWLGGSGLAQWILYNEVKPWVTPYAPANRLIISSGPLNGTLSPGASRLSADSINPLTFGVGSSNSCGHFAPELKFAGYDHIILKGKARKPVYLCINDEHIELKDAHHLWGKTTYEADEMIKRELDDQNIQIISIGPAGENIARGACIIVNMNRALGRCGLGGVMGSKNLKAIAVRGSGEVEVADPARFMKAVDEIRKQIEQSDFVKNFVRLGTIYGVKGKQDHCGVPYKNFQYLVFPEEAYAKWNPESFNKAYRVRNMGYMACDLPCSRYIRIDRGTYAGLETEGFQMEALMDFSGKLAIEDPSSCIKVSVYCNQMGLDMDSAAGAIGWAMECYQRGILKESDTDGLKLKWGDTEVILELIRKIAYREGFGDVLAEGCAKASQIIGRDSSYYAIHLKGQDLYEVLRPNIGGALGACVATRGGGHTTSAPGVGCQVPDEEVLEKVYGVRTANQPLVFEGKSKLVGYFERLSRIANSLGICHFATTSLNPTLIGFPEFAELFSAATGWEMADEDLKRAATRILNVEKAFNILHADFSRKDDYPPQRCLEEPIPSGSAMGFKLEKEKWDAMLDDYYKMNKWDSKTSFPTRRGLEELDLKQIADDLEIAGKLGSD